MIAIVCDPTQSASFGLWVCVEMHWVSYTWRAEFCEATFATLSAASRGDSGHPLSPPEFPA